VVLRLSLVNVKLRFFADSVFAYGPLPLVFVPLR